jgi:hypothetical protein
MVFMSWNYSIHGTAFRAQPHSRTASTGLLISGGAPVLGSREFDPKYVGFRTTSFDGAFAFCTDKAGNSNAGHEFRNGTGKGVIGPELTDDERWAIIEYLKSM